MVKDCTIIIPVYVTTTDGIDWLKECLDSAFQQDCHVSVCKDGPFPDPEIDFSVMELLTKIPARKGLTVIRSKQHGGVSTARNLAVMQATTKFILPLDCDDRLKPGAVEKMISAYKGVPLYPDVTKFGEEDEPWFVLLDFHCDHIVTHVGFTSVNVLQEKAMWETIGGWDSTLDFYEDGEYNARLYSRYCGQRYPEPLVDYRIHSSQRTKTYNSRAAEYARNIMEKVRILPMGCASCGGGTPHNSNPSSLVEAPANVDPYSLPGEQDGLVLSQYVGGEGKGVHYQNGHVTNFPYKVEYGGYYYVDPKDTREASDTRSRSKFIRIHKPEETITTSPTPVPVRTPVVEHQKSAQQLSAMSVREVQRFVQGLDKDTLLGLVMEEKKGKNRPKVVELLNVALENKS